MTKWILSMSVVFFIIACAQKDKKASDNVTSEKVTSETSIDGAQIFKKNCELCHGADGKLGLNGSKDLSISALSIEEKTLQVTKGKGVMPPYENILTPEEIKAVVDYTMTLKK